MLSIRFAPAGAERQRWKAGRHEGWCRLARLAERGLAQLCGMGRYQITEAGALRHAREVLKRPTG
jgi:hypothetical protein